MQSERILRQAWGKFGINAAVCSVQVYLCIKWAKGYYRLCSLNFSQRWLFCVVVGWLGLCDVSIQKGRRTQPWRIFFQFLFVAGMRSAHSFSQLSLFLLSLFPRIACNTWNCAFKDLTDFPPAEIPELIPGSGIPSLLWFTWPSIEWCRRAFLLHQCAGGSMYLSCSYIAAWGFMGWFCQLCIVLSMVLWCRF